MNIEAIKDKDITLVLVVRGQENWDKGLKFVSSDEDYLQVGFWNYDKGQKLKEHIHLICSREVLKTQEIILVKQGNLKVDIYTNEEKFLKSIELKTEDIAIFLSGGHGYEILEDNTKVVEIKNGPYVGADKDRKRI